MRRLKHSAILAATVLACGCGGAVSQTCDEVRLYQLAREGKRIEAPEGLSGLDELKEIPLPEASPRPQRPEGSPCLDLPPNILIQGSSDQ